MNFTALKIFSNLIGRLYGSSAHVNCKISTTISYTVTEWYLNGKKLPITDNSKYTVSRRTLIVNSVQPEDEGVYTCRFTSGSNTLECRADDLHVLGR